MSALRTYLLSVAAASLLCGVVLSLLPKGGIRGIVRLLGAMLLIMAVVSPVLKLDTETISVELDNIHTYASDIQEKSLEESERLFSQLIKEQCEAYILDKAGRSVQELDVQIIMGHDGYPHPVGVKLCGDLSSEDKRYISAVIEQDLGIPKQRQEWIDRE